MAADVFKDELSEANEAARRLAEWLARELPPRTSIHDPAWWASRILRAIGYQELLRQRDHWRAAVVAVETACDEVAPDNLARIVGADAVDDTAGRWQVQGEDGEPIIEASTPADLVRALFLAWVAARPTEDAAALARAVLHALRDGHDGILPVSDRDRIEAAREECEATLARLARKATLTPPAEAGVIVADEPLPPAMIALINRQGERLRGDAPTPAAEAEDAGARLVKRLRDISADLGHQTPPDADLIDTLDFAADMIVDLLRRHDEARRGADACHGFAQAIDRAHHATAQREKARADAAEARERELRKLCRGAALTLTYMISQARNISQSEVPQRYRLVARLRAAASGGEVL